MALRIACTLVTITTCLGSFFGPHPHLGSRRDHPGVALRSPAMSADTLTAFDEWLEERDLLATAKVSAARVEGFGVCLTAKEALLPGDAVLAVPRRLHITAKRAEGTELGEALETLKITDESVVLAMVLLEQMALGKDSEWARYLELLPSADELALPLLWPDAERAVLLEGSHLLGCVDALLADLRQQWAVIEAGLVQPNPDHFPALVYRFEGFAWATAIVLSRALPFADSLALIPFLDLANHNSGSINACSIRVSGDATDGGAAQSEEWELDDLSGESAAVLHPLPCYTRLPCYTHRTMQRTPNHATHPYHAAHPHCAAPLHLPPPPYQVLTMGSAHAAGEQVFIDYAGEGNWRSSWEMLYTYGFVPGLLPQEWLEAGGRPLLLDGVQRDDPLHEQKVAALVALGAEEGGAYEMWIDVKADPKEVPDAMAPLLRLAHLGRESAGEAAAAEGGEAAAGEAAAGEAATSELVDAAWSELVGAASPSELVGKMAKWQAPPDEVWRAVQQRLSAANERAVASQLVGECEAALAMLPSSEKIAERLASSESRAALAGRVLAGERHALEGCRAHWQKVRSEAA